MGGQFGSPLPPLDVRGLIHLCYHISYIGVEKNVILMFALRKCNWSLATKQIETWNG